MPDRTPALIAAIITFVLLVIGAFLFSFAQMVALNGVLDESKALQSLGLGVLCQGVTILAASAFAGWLTGRLVRRFQWKPGTAALAAVALSTLLGLGAGLLSIVISIPMAGIR